MFNGVPDGRVYGGGCVTAVEGSPGDPIHPVCPASRASGQEIKWDEEDNIRVEQLRQVVRI